MLFLGIIEEKVIKIVKAYKDIAYRNSEHFADNTVPAPFSKKINEAFTFDDLDDDDEEY